MSQPFKTPFFSDTEFKNMKEILPYSSNSAPAIRNLGTYLEKIPPENYQEELKRIRLLFCSMGEQEKITAEDLSESSTNKVEIKLTSAVPGSDISPDSPQYQTIINGINEQLKQQIAELQNENNQLKQRVLRQAEQFQQISALADQLISPPTIAE